MYSEANRSVLAVFGSAAWTRNGIKTYPANFLAKDAGEEFIKISVITSGPGLNLISKSGMLIIDIYTPAGNGPSRPYSISDELDLLLKNKSYPYSGNVTQFSSSSLNLMGSDSANRNLHRAQYTIPFKHNGVF